MLTDSLTLFSGLGRCGREIALRYNAHPDYEIIEGGWHHSGMPHNLPVQIIPIVRGHGTEPEILYQAIQQFRPHYFLGIGDPFYFPWLGDLKKKVADTLDDPPIHYLGWITLDGDPIQQSQLRHLLPFDRIAPMSRFAEREIRRAILALQSKDLDVIEKPGERDRIAQEQAMSRPHVTCKTIYPGVDPQTFRFQGAAWEYKGHKYTRDSDFVTLIVDQNTSRKCVSVALEAFAQFQADKPDVLLYLATDPKDPNGLDPVEMLEGFEEYPDTKGTRDKVFLRENNPVNGMSDEELSQVYCVASALFSCTTGEGFKLPIIEAMISGCIPIMPGYSSIPELLEGGRGITIPTAGHLHGSHSYRKAIVSIDEAAASLEKAYELWQGRHEKDSDLMKMQQAGQRFASGLSWDKAFEAFENLMAACYRDREVELQVI